MGESLIAQGNAITQGENCGASVSHGQCRRSCDCAVHDEAVSKGMCHVSFLRPAFGGNDCEGPDIEAELCHQQVKFSLLMFTVGLRTEHLYCLLSRPLYPALYTFNDHQKIIN